MRNEKRKKAAADKSTRHYIKNVRLLQAGFFLIMSISFIVLAYVVVLNNRNNLKVVALAEVQESMRETVNNTVIHIDSVRARIQNDVRIDILDLEGRIESGGVTGVEDIVQYLAVSEENQLGQAIEALYTTSDGECYYIAKYDRTVTCIEGSSQSLYADAAFYEVCSIDNQELILFVKQSEVDALVKEEIHAYLHSEVYDGNQYVWVNEVLNMEGGDAYAIRRIHPNLVDTEGEYLSTAVQDMKGNYPYQTELAGIRENGYVYQSYYFKNKLNDEMTEKFSYAQYYEPFHWIVATGETIEEVYAYSEEMNRQSVYRIIIMMGIFVVLCAATSAVMIKMLESQTESFKKTLLKQTEVFEDIYNAMSTGLMRIRVSEKDAAIIHINPKGLELLGLETESEYSEKISQHIASSMDDADGKKLEEMASALKEQWQSAVTECWVTWKDNSRHLLRIRDTLVDFEGQEKIIQRMCQDITEEYYQQEQALMAAEERANLDPMTQIKNKRAIEMCIRTKVAEAAEQYRAIAVGFVDIDNFREYNTKYGHMQGDEVIKYVANVLKEAIRGEVGRNGGDEFAFVMLDASYEEVEQIMKDIYKKLNEGIVIMETGEKIPTPCSIGVVIEKKKALDYEDVMKKSDTAMYEAKAEGKNTYHIL